MNAIEVNGLCKRYPDFALQDISFSLPQGSILGLVGENGAGKSTTLRLLMGAEPCDAGTATVLGVNSASPAFTETKQDIGVVLDEAYFPEALTARRLGAVMRATYRRWNDAQYNAFLAKLSLPQDKIFSEFSRGMKMKLAIAVALSHAPQLLVLDEATGGLDPMVRDEILDAFNEFTRDETHSILISSHIVSDLEKLCDYIAFLHKGRLLLFEEKDRLLEEYALLRLPRERFEALPAEAVKGMKKSDYGVEALVLRSGIPAAFATEHTTLEDIILFLAKGDDTL